MAALYVRIGMTDTEIRSLGVTGAHGLRINSQMAASCEPVLMEEKKVVVIQYLLVSSKTLREGEVQGQNKAWLNLLLLTECC